MRLALLLSSVLLLTPTWLSAQTSPPAARDAQPHILIDTVGPDGWRMRLGPTNLGSLLESEKGRELWEPHLEPLLGMWQQLAGDEASFAASRTRMLDYGGRVRMAMWLDSESGPNSHDPAACIAVVLEGDGRSDLSAIAEDLRTTLYQAMPGEWSDTEIDGTQFAVRSNDDMSVTAPILEGERLLIAASNEGDLELALRRARKLAGDQSEKIKPNSPALRVQFDFASIIAMAMGNAPGDDLAMMKALGFDTIGTGTATLGTAGPRIQLEFAQAFTADERGLFSALLPSTPSIPSLLLAMPKEGTWSVGHLDCLKVYETVLEAVIAADVGGDTDLRAKIKEDCGIDPAEDLLAHMTDDVMFWLPEADDFDDRIDKTPWTMTWRLRDEDAFRDGLFALLPKARPFLQRETTETHGDVELFRYGNMLGYDIWLAVGRGVFVFAGGRDAEERIGTVLDGCVDLPAEIPADRRLPEEFMPVKRYLPPGCHGFAIGNATNLVSLPTSLWFDAIGWFTPMPGIGVDLDPDEDVERREALAELLEKHRLNVARSATGYAERTWHWRLYW